MSVQTDISRNFITPQQYGTASPLLWLCGAMLVLLAASIVFSQFDDRLINGVNIWDKPGKFALALTVHAFTLAWGLQYATTQIRNNRSTRIAVSVFVVAVAIEMSWMTFQSSQGQASHFDRSTAFTTFMYNVMGIGAVCLTTVTVVLGWKIARSGNSAMHLAIGCGFILSGILTTIVAGYMGGQTGHSVGGDLTDATGLGFFHWSTTGGDLRVPHFAALHTAQALPFLAWLIPDRRVVTLGAVVAIAVTAGLFAQALMGIPFLAR